MLFSVSLQTTNERYDCGDSENQTIPSFSLGYSCVKYYDTPSTFSEAQTTCEAEGGFIYSANTESKHLLLSTSFGIGITNGQTPVSTWLGARQHTDDNVWHWTTRCENCPKATLYESKLKVVKKI